MPVGATSARWSEIDSSWDELADTTSTVLQPELVTLTEEAVFAESWNCVDSWWETNIESQRDALVELQTELDAAQRVWADSASRFDSDPLTANWTANTGSTGPLRTNQEENWSQWLAHLIRTGPPLFPETLFGFHATSTSVDREVHLPAHAEPDRYADVLAFYGDRAVSIEVKKGDEHYAKTIHTASLIESQYREEWRHVLLVPGRKRGVLDRSFGERVLETDDGTKIRSERSTDIEVVHWLDVGRAIRRVLLSKTDSDAHWAASAYLFCTLLEQKIARFVPKPVVDRIIESKNVVRTASSSIMVGHDVDEQTAYLRETITD